MKSLVPLLVLVCVAMLGVAAAKRKVTRKCCGVSETMVESGPGHRPCKSATQVGHKQLVMNQWKNVKLSDYVINHGKPLCEDGEHLTPIYDHAGGVDTLNLLTNGSLTHSGERVDGRGVTYDYIKYCVDQLVMNHNYSGVARGQMVDFAYVCIDRSLGVAELVEKWVYPVGVALSMGCLTLTFLLYSLLPQLRDLTGKFILGICAFLTTSYALRLVDIFGFKDPNVQKLVTELLLHSCVVGAWLCVNSMGHHVWKIIRSKSVFTRVTDGQRCCYYSLFVSLGTGSTACLALAVHFLIGNGVGFGDSLTNNSEEDDVIPPSLGSVSWEALAVLYFPICLLLLANLYFYWTSQRQIGRQLVYNRSMQHFQVNFDLFSKLLMVVSVCWFFQTLALIPLGGSASPAFHYIAMVFTILQGPLIFIVAMCRTRVVFLFKRYFCQDTCCIGCCRGDNEFIEIPTTEMDVIDKLKEKEEKAEVADVKHSLLEITKEAPNDHREMSRSLFNVRGKGGDSGESPIVKVGRMLKSNSMNLASLNWGWRKETSV